MTSRVEIEKLTPEERLALIEAIWDSLDPDDVPVTDAQRAELDRRRDEMETDDELGIPWNEVLRRIRDRAK